MCKLMEAGRLGNEGCYGPAMLGLLAQDDVNLTPGREEGENELVSRVRTWISSVFDEVEDQVIVAVYSMYSRQILPLYPDPMAVVVSGDMQVFTLVTEQGVALLSAKG